jgi:hypothetical protein
MHPVVRRLCTAMGPTVGGQHNYLRWKPVHQTLKRIYSSLHPLSQSTVSVAQANETYLTRWWATGFPPVGPGLRFEVQILDGITWTSAKSVSNSRLCCIDLLHIDSMSLKSRSGVEILHIGKRICVWTSPILTVKAKTTPPQPVNLGN